MIDLSDILHARLDFVTFAIAWTGAAVLAQLWLRRRYGDRRLPFWAWATVLGLVAIAGFSAETAAQREYNRLRFMVQGLAPTFAEELNRLGHSKIGLTTSPDDPTYLAMIDAQKRWLRCNPQIGDIYTVVQRADGAHALLVDSETDYDHNGVYEGDREARTEIGEEFGDDDENLSRAFAGFATFDAEAYTDRWGTWVSCYEPMHDPDGNVTAVVGVDYEASGWNAAALRARGILLGFVGVLEAVLLGSAVTVTALRSELKRRLTVETALRETEVSLRQLALHDPLTNLPNRTLLHDRLAQALARAGRYPTSQFALLYLDLDRFKVVNDSLGHEIGDALLRAVADRLREALRASDTISRCPTGSRPRESDTLAVRLGGDEFVILLDPVADPSDAERVAERVQQTLSQPYVLNGRRVQTSVSIGITLSHPRYASAAELLRDADTAMYRAKAGGRSRSAVFNPAMHEQAVERLTAEHDLRLAIERNEMILEYQPIIDLNDGCLRGFEALVRWQHPTKGKIAPDRFIPLAEETGLIVPLGHWVLKEACEALARWRRSTPLAAAMTMSINISRRQFESASIVRELDQVMGETGVRPTDLKLEITESLIAHDPDASTAVIGQLRQLGVPLVVDDFGMGSSSLGSLHRFPLEGLKIDRSFIANASQNRDYAAVVHTIAELARNLGMSVVAEGVETADQATMLQAMGCSMAQGYLFARPLSEADSVSFIIERKSQKAA